ncbi:MAG TPA: hypothetical protein VEJ18_20715 [Planctomycetota bacterium]|nr:hypothetical protein [Planctomycetota bacterium]
MITIGIDEVGYGPYLGPLVVAAAVAREPLRCPVPLGDSKKLFCQARGVGTLEPAVLGYLPSPTFRTLCHRLRAGLPESPWYCGDLPLPAVDPLDGLDAAAAVIVDPAEFNARTKTLNKSDFLFEVVAGLIGRLREAVGPEPLRILVGKHGGRQFYLRSLNQLVSPTVWVREETRRRSAYDIPGATIEFLEDAEEAHELVALASMIGKYVRERAMELFNFWWACRVEKLRPTAGYGADGRRFWRDVAPHAQRLGVPGEAILRLR